MCFLSLHYSPHSVYKDGGALTTRGLKSREWMGPMGLRAHPQLILSWVLAPPRVRPLCPVTGVTATYSFSPMLAVSNLSSANSSLRELYFPPLGRDSPSVMAPLLSYHLTQLLLHLLLSRNAGKSSVNQPNLAKVRSLKVCSIRICFP